MQRYFCHRIVHCSAAICFPSCFGTLPFADPSPSRPPHSHRGANEMPDADAAHATPDAPQITDATSLLDA
eukprot:2457215-Pyramimonas_sp.AAC.1